jgi:NAD(P)H-nitrite reductase large subunit
MAGKKYNLTGEVAYNMLPVFDCTAAFLERRDAGDDQTQVLTYINKRKSIYRKILVKNNRLVGAVMLGACQDAGVALYPLRKRKNIARIKDTLASGRALWGDVMKNNLFI